MNKWLLTLQLAWRFLTSSRQNSYVKLLIKICFAGIALGSTALAMTLMIMSGFEQEARQKARGMHSHAILSCPNDSPLDWVQLQAKLEPELKGQISAISAQASSQAIIDHGKYLYPLNLRAVDTATFGSLCQLQKYITPYLNATGPTATTSKPNLKINLTKVLSNNNVLIGHKIAKTLNLNLGDKINLLLPEIVKNRVKLKESVAIISGFIDVGFSEFDSGTLLCSLDFLWQLNGNNGQVDSILINFITSQSSNNHTISWQNLYQHLLRLIPWQNEFEVQQVKILQPKQPDFKIQAWQELYPALISSMRLEKYAMVLVLFLISIVAIMNMIALLVVQIQTRRKEIVILKILGLSNSSIRLIFTLFGMSITVFASLSGLFLATFLGYFFTHHLPIALPDAYLVTFLPFDLHPINLVLVFGLTCLAGLLASWIPANQAAKLSIIKVLKNI